MDFADVFNAISAHMGSTNWFVRGLVAHPDLKGFDQQETGIEMFPIEYVKQSGCGDYGFHGTLYLPTTYSNGDGGVLYIRVEFSD